VSFYDQVMRELVLALGGALFVANALALFRRRSDAERSEAGSVRGGPASGKSFGDNTADLPQAPLARTVAYMLVGLVVALWALASIINS
jgi:hypothetical protein